MEYLFTLGIMAFLGAMAYFSMGLPKETIAGDPFGASGFPLIVIAIGLLLCAILLVQQVRHKHMTEGRLLDLSTPHARAILYSALVLAVYLAMLNVLGFVLSTFIFALVAPLVMGYRKIGKLVLFASVATCALFLLFGKAFYVPLPRGAGVLQDLSYLLY